MHNSAVWHEMIEYSKTQKHLPRTESSSLEKLFCDDNDSQSGSSLFELSPIPESTWLLLVL